MLCERHAGKKWVHERARVEAIRDIRSTKGSQNEAKPEKCAFSVRADRFLRFMILERGIEVNLEKIQAIMEMPPLRTIKEIQHLTGKVVTLNKFISRMADKYLSFFKALRTSLSWAADC